MTPKVAIIGAGLAGLTAAHRLLSRPSPPEVVIIDKGRRIGGRMCTRAVDLPDGRQARFDLGPPNLYVRRAGGGQHRPEESVLALGRELSGEQAFRVLPVARFGAAGETVANAPLAGVTVNGGMRELAFRLTGLHGPALEVRDNTQAERLQRTDDGWRVHTRSLLDGSADYVDTKALILTAPVPQSLELLNNSEVELPDDIRDQLRTVEYARCLTLYGLFGGSGTLPAGGLWLGDGSVEWVIDNALRGLSPVGPAVTAHAHPDWAAAHWHEPDPRLIERLAAAVRPWAGDPVGPVHLQRWRYARPLNPVRAACYQLRDLALVLAGDGFSGGTPDPADAAVASGADAARRAEGLLTRALQTGGRLSFPRPTRFTLEVAVCTADEAYRAVLNGADRLELSAALEVGGLTPSAELVRAVRQRVGADVPVYALVRPRPGGFVYWGEEIDQMEADADALVRAGADGIVFGALRSDGTIHEGACRRLVAVSGGHAVFHRAFDLVPDPFSTLDRLAALGCERVLTSGGAATAETGTTRLAALVQHAGWQIEVLPCGSVRGHNVEDLVRATRCNQVHAAPRVQRPDPVLDDRPALALAFGSATDLDADAVAGLRAGLNQLAESLSLTE